LLLRIKEKSRPLKRFQKRGGEKDCRRQKSRKTSTLLGRKKQTAFQRKGSRRLGKNILKQNIQGKKKASISTKQEKKRTAVYKDPKEDGGEKILVPGPKEKRRRGIALATDALEQDRRRARRWV